MRFILIYEDRGGGGIGAVAAAASAAAGIAASAGLHIVEGDGIDVARVVLEDVAADFHVVCGYGNRIVRQKRWERRGAERRVLLDQSKALQDF